MPRHLYSYCQVLHLAILDQVGWLPVRARPVPFGCCAAEYEEPFSSGARAR